MRPACRLDDRAGPAGRLVKPAEPRIGVGLYQTGVSRQEAFGMLAAAVRREEEDRCRGVIRDIRRKIDGNAVLEDRFAQLLDLAMRMRHQDQHQRGPKVYALHAPEVECIGKGKARAPYEFGCKVSVATPVTQPKGGQFVLHANALHGNPFVGHTLGPIVADMEKLTGVEARLPGPTRTVNYAVGMKTAHPRLSNGPSIEPSDLARNLPPVLRAGIVPRGVV
jgi:hypothetical protein